MLLFVYTTTRKRFVNTTDPANQIAEISHVVV